MTAIGPANEHQRARPVHEAAGRSEPAPHRASRPPTAHTASSGVALGVAEDQAGRGEDTAADHARDDHEQAGPEAKPARQLGCRCRPRTGRRSPGRMPRFLPHATLPLALPNRTTSVQGDSEPLAACCSCLATDLEADGDLPPLPLVRSGWRRATALRRPRSSRCSSAPGLHPGRRASRCAILIAFTAASSDSASSRPARRCA